MSDPFDWREPAHTARIRNRDLQRMPLVSEPVFVMPEQIVRIACVAVEFLVMAGILAAGFTAWVAFA